MNQIQMITEIVMQCLKRNQGKKKPYKCEYCDQSCLLLNDLQHHVATIHKCKTPFKCENCEFSCPLMDSLLNYIASVHGGKKPSKYQHLVSVHEGKRPFKCESCYPNGELRKHVASDHEGKKPFNCESCGNALIGNLQQPCCMKEKHQSNAHVVIIPAH